MSSYTHRRRLPVPPVQPNIRSTHLFGVGYRGQRVISLGSTAFPRSSGEKECVICRSDIQSIRFPVVPPTSECSHESEACFSCLSTYLEVEVESGRVNNIHCPKTSCRQVLSFRDVKLWAGPSTFERYDQLLCRQTLQGVGKWRFCKNPECNSGQEHIGGAEQPLMRCRDCGTTACYVHDIRWHEGYSCEEYDDMQRSTGVEMASRATAEFLRRETKACPNCQASIQKNEGCDHMTCRKPGGCGYEFCWICFNPFKIIAQEGNHMHKVSCPYYAIYSA